MSKTPEEVKQKILDAAVRDICSVSVAPAAKSAVRRILSIALDRYGEAVRTYIVNGVIEVEQSIIDQHVTEAVANERAFVLNVLDGIDIADGKCNTKAIRHALSTRAV